MPETYTFGGDAVTILGLVGVISAFVIVVTAFKRFYYSPYNIRVTPNQVSTETSTDPDSTVS